MKRSVTAALLVAAATVALAGCAGAPAPVVCEGGDIRMLQQIPADLPGGGSAGFTESDMDADPPRVHLMMAGESTPAPDVPTYLVVGDAFTVDGAEYEVTCISGSIVTLEVR